MEHKVNTLWDLKNLLSTLTDFQLAQPAIIWGEGIQKQKIDNFVVLDEDYIDPSGDGAERISLYMPGSDSYDPDFDAAAEPIVAHKGEIFFEIVFKA